MKPCLVLALAMVLLQGCDAFREWQASLAPRHETQAAEDPAALRLTEAALRAEAALAALAQARTAENPAQAQPPPHLVPAALLEDVTIDWIGPLPPLAARLAEAAGFAFIETGARPPVPPIVQITAEAAPVILVLRDAGLQVADRALLVVDARARQVRLEWKPHRGEPI